MKETKRQLAARPQSNPELPIWWMDKAACKGMETDLFFPKRKCSRRHRNVSCDVCVALEVCYRCPVISECLKDAVARESTLVDEYRRYGIWGGMQAHERLLLSRAKITGRDI